MHIVKTHRMQLCLSCPSYGQSFFFSFFSLLLRVCVHINNITPIHFFLVMQYTNMLLTLRIQRKRKKKKVFTSFSSVKVFLAMTANQTIRS